MLITKDRGGGPFTSSVIEMDDDASHTAWSIGKSVNSSVGPGKENSLFLRPDFNKKAREYIDCDQDAGVED
jgi:hypothetical protein